LPVTLIRRPAGAEGDAEAAVREELVTLEELVAAVVAVPAVVIPALHAARDKQAAMATAAGRYLFIVVLKGVKKVCCAKPRQPPSPAYGERVASLRHPARSRHV
jgi:hypothetical protein